MTYYASFGTPKRSAEAEAFTDKCYQAGYEWGRTQETLPISIKIDGRRVQIRRSIHENAHAFVDGWKTARAAH